MATTKKTTKAKSKTTKTVRQAQVKKASTKTIKVTKKTITSRASSLVTEQLKTINIVSAVASILLAGAAGYLMSNASYQFFTSLLTKDQLTSTTSTVFVPAIHAFHDLELRWIVVTIMLLAGIMPILYLTKLKAQNAANIKAKVNPLRWISMGVISSLMVMTIALLSGVQDAMTLILVGALIAITSVIGWVAERQKASGGKSDKSLHILSIVTGALPWLLIATYAGGTLLYGMVRSPWFVYALYASLLVSFIAYCLNGKRLQKTQSYEVTERNYALISLFANVAFAVILIVGLYKK